MHQRELTRWDIEGLRAISLVLVLAYHFFPVMLPGGYLGVDVFFVISGYLITQSLLRQPHADSLWRNLISFWSRRVRRLLPNSIAVLFATSVAGLLLLPDYSLRILGTDVAWAGLYSVNWLSVRRALDYLEWDTYKATALLNFWSLSLEEQFYILWPIVLLFTLRLHRQHTHAQLRGALYLTTILALLSLVYCITEAGTNATLAFFSTIARAWELLAGSLLALRFPGTSNDAGYLLRPSRIVIGGLSAVVVSALIFDAETAHPGLATLLPVLATGVVLKYGAATAGTPVHAVLTSAPLRYLGQRSYSIYLWHFPILILAQRSWQTTLSLSSRVFMLALSLAIAELAYRFIENPFRFRWGLRLSPLRIVSYGAATAVTIAMFGLTVRDLAASGARTLITRNEPTLLTRIDLVRNDLPAIYFDGCHLDYGTLTGPKCIYGASANRSVAVLFGDSHAAQWFPAIDMAAKTQRAALYSRTKSNCPSIEITVWNEMTRRPDGSCDEWRRQVATELQNVRPKIIFVSNLIDERTGPIDPATGRRAGVERARELFRNGMVRTLEQLRGTGAAVIVIRDTPRQRDDLLDCVSTATSEEQCTTVLTNVRRSHIDVEAAQLAGAPLWDFSEYICPKGVCPAFFAVPPMPIYRDPTHLTASFVRQNISQQLEQKWVEVESHSELSGAAARVLFSEFLQMGK